ncbi:SGNH/GDSL hydrolase family protein [Paucibacter sp. APW11]|uniref:SGNH/GDSL hydrolase family protein n=1 Tax=Roseateles aquae TaxID=3077235 RepID=A0ABU3P730_9BURK|nr:SGNH/GDSL hydrolase family protein [Paucibacter sp. APW11]MDT8998338.1 SGNH/GDSL hydrolase family protein [Paucibacter sp. APW11]
MPQLNSKGAGLTARQDPAGGAMMHWQGEAQPLPIGRAGSRVLLFGHSYLDQETDTFTFNRPIENLNGTVVWANFLLDRPWEIVRGHAIGGERLIDMADRISQGAAERYAAVFWNAGINDLKNTKNTGNSRYTGLPYVTDSDQTDLSILISRASKQLYQLVKLAAMVVILPETSPANGAGDQTRWLAHRTAQLNRWYRWLAASDPRFHYVPLDEITWDPVSAAGDVRSGMYGDSIHPGCLGAFLRGKMLAAYMGSYVRPNIYLPHTVVDAWTNLKLTGTALASNGDGTLRVTMNNSQAGTAAIRKGDKATINVPVAGQKAWNGRWTVVAATTTYIDLACAVPGSYTGTINVSTANNVFDNPLFVTTTGGSSSGGGTVTGTVPSGCSIDIPAGSSVTNSFSAHTDRSGQADQFGNWWQMDFVLGANALVQIYLNAHRDLEASPVYGRLALGADVVAEMELEVLASPTPTGISKLQVGISSNYTPPSASQQTLQLFTFYRSGTVTSAHPNAACRGVAGLPPWRIPADAGGVLNSLDGLIQLQAGASGATVSIRIARATISAVDNLLRDSTVAYDI